MNILVQNEYFSNFWWLCFIFFPSPAALCSAVAVRWWSSVFLSLLLSIPGSPQAAAQQTRQGVLQQVGGAPPGGPKPCRKVERIKRMPWGRLFFFLSFVCFLFCMPTFRWEVKTRFSSPVVITRLVAFFVRHGDLGEIPPWLMTCCLPAEVPAVASSCCLPPPLPAIN